MSSKEGVLRMRGKIQTEIIETPRIHPIKSETREEFGRLQQTRLVPVARERYTYT